MEIDGAVAVVTGGTGAVGEQVMNMLAAKGARPVAWDLYVNGYGEEVIPCDVGSDESVEEAMRLTEERFGTPSVLVTVAAVSGGFSPLASEATEAEWGSVLTAPDTWERVLRTNVVGVANCMRSFSRRLAAAGKPGSIVNITSISSGPVTEPGLVAYSASKAAVNQLTRVSAAELGPLGIRVNAVGPGLMAEPMRGPSRANGAVTAQTDSRPADFAPAIKKFVPIEQRHGRGEDIAQAVGAVIEMDWVTGQIIMADGGLTLRSPVTT